MSATRQSPQDILRARAADLARPLPVDRGGRTLFLVEFRLGSERYAVEQAYAIGVQPLQALTPLPGTADFLRGIIHVRGNILPVIDIKRLFDLPLRGVMDFHVVLEVRVGEVDVGILADLVVGVQSIPQESLQESLPTLTGIRADFLKGVTRDALIVLDVPRMLADPRMTFDDVSQDISC